MTFCPKQFGFFSGSVFGFGDDAFETDVGRDVSILRRRSFVEQSFSPPTVQKNKVNFSPTSYEPSLSLSLSLSLSHTHTHTHTRSPYPPPLALSLSFYVSLSLPIPNLTYTHCLSCMLRIANTNAQTQADSHACQNITHPYARTHTHIHTPTHPHTHTNTHTQTNKPPLSSLLLKL